MECRAPGRQRALPAVRWTKTADQILAKAQRKPFRGTLEITPQVRLLVGMPPAKEPVRQIPHRSRQSW
ncbi:hypothetical protein GCM10011608_06220 [Micromonospora sonchi]|uniref:Uncharacterized protein n=1 Tax=Micromonospora sonchi TaxID=1763543 RepID=A0A917TIY8_9ACTN|nr:hypothetical protein GCM10011608_06220 [Micromonospora sonchi]